VREPIQKKPSYTKMTSDSSSLPAPPIFAGGNFHLRAAKMMTYLRAQSLWDTMENGSNPPSLPENPKIAHLPLYRQHYMMMYLSRF